MVWKLCTPLCVYLISAVQPHISGAWICSDLFFVPGTNQPALVICLGRVNSWLSLQAPSFGRRLGSLGIDQMCLRHVNLFLFFLPTPSFGCRIKVSQNRPVLSLVQILSFFFFFLPSKFVWWNLEDHMLIMWNSFFQMLKCFVLKGTLPFLETSAQSMGSTTVCMRVDACTHENIPLLA